MFRSTRIAQYLIFGVFTLSILWWFDPTDMRYFGQPYILQYQDNVLVRWGKEKDILRDIKGDLIFRGDKQHAETLEILPPKK